MQIDSLGLPKVNGASDKQDSSHFAGMLTLFDFAPEQWKPVQKLHQYLIVRPTGEKYYTRHPAEQIYDFSRDQTIPLISGYWRIKDYAFVNQKYVTGRDIFTPDVKGHIKRCQNREANWFENLWLKTAILAHAKFTPLNEPNNIICMSMIAGDKYVQMWKNHNSQWKQSIRNYWGGWRGEDAFGEHMISVLEKI